MLLGDGGNCRLDLVDLSGRAYSNEPGCLASGCQHWVGCVRYLFAVPCVYCGDGFRGKRVQEWLGMFGVVWIKAAIRRGLHERIVASVSASVCVRKHFAQGGHLLRPNLGRVVMFGSGGLFMRRILARIFRSCQAQPESLVSDSLTVALDLFRYAFNELDGLLIRLCHVPQAMGSRLLARVENRNRCFVFENGRVHVGTLKAKRQQLLGIMAREPTAAHAPVALVA